MRRVWGPWLYFRIPIRRNPRGWRKTKFFFRILVAIFAITLIWQALFGHHSDPYATTKSTAPAGSPSYCVGTMGNDVGQGAVIDAMVDRDCPQFHGYRVALYQNQQSYIQAGEPVPAGSGFPWCPVLNENPCVPTPDMTEPQG